MHPYPLDSFQTGASSPHSKRTLSGGPSVRCFLICQVPTMAETSSSTQGAQENGPMCKKDLLISATPRIVKYAKKGKYAKLVEALDRGDPINSVDNCRRSALFHAALKGHMKCLKELLKRGANPNQ